MTNILPNFENSYGVDFAGFFLLLFLMQVAFREAFNDCLSKDNLYLYSASVEAVHVDYSKSTAMTQIMFPKFKWILIEIA